MRGHWERSGQAPKAGSVLVGQDTLNKTQEMDIGMGAALGPWTSHPLGRGEGSGDFKQTSMSLGVNDLDVASVLIGVRPMLGRVHFLPLGLSFFSCTWLA